MKVECRELAEFPGYRIGNDGSVWSNKRIGKSRKGVKWRRLRGFAHADGYLQYQLTTGEGKRVTRSGHRLVMEAFVGPCPERQECCHGPNCEPGSERLANLRWGTRKENAIGQGLHGQPRRFSSREVWEIRNRLAQGEGVEELAVEYRASAKTLQEIKYNTRYPYYGLDRDLMYWGDGMWGPNPLPVEDKLAWSDSRMEALRGRK